MRRLRAARPTSAAAPARRWSRPLAWAAVLVLSAVAAAVPLLRQKPVATIESHPNQPSLVPAGPAQPVVTQEHLLAVRPLGLVHDADNRVVRLVEYTWLDLQTYGALGASGVSSSALRREVVPVRLPVQ